MPPTSQVQTYTNRHATKLYRRRFWINRLMIILASTACMFALFWLAWILWSLITKGVPAFFHLSFFTEITPPPGEDGGLANAFVGSMLIVCLATFIGTPLGILAGIYLAEYGRYGIDRKFAAMVRFINDLLLSTPSIIIGLFTYALIVSHTKSFSGFAGSVALSLLVIPVVLRTTDEMLRLVPHSLREAAIALGCPLWKMITAITLRSAKKGLVTAVLLAVARISGETAPLLFTALSNQFWSFDMFKPMANLPVVIFQYAMSPYDSWHTLAWGGALAITMSVLFLNILARFLTRDKL